MLDEGEEAATNVFVHDGDDWLLDREVESADEPTAAEVKQRPEKWCQVQPGMTKDEVIEIMGEPTGQFAGTNPQLNYDAFEYGFTAFFGVDGTVRQLDANTINLTPEQVEAIPCENNPPLTRGGLGFGGGAGTAQAAPLAPATARMSRWLGNGPPARNSPA